MSEERQGEGTRGTYVYGVVPSGASLDAIGRDGNGLPDVRLVEVGDVAALVSDGPERATREVLLTHGRVLEAMLESASVVPLRFGMVVTGDDAVRDEILEAHHDELVQLLDRFEDRVQMTLKAYYHEESVVAEILAADPQNARLREAIQGQPEDAIYKQRVSLGERLNTAIEKRKERDGEEILQRLRPLAEAISLEPPEDELMVAHTVFLLTRDRVQEFDATLEEVAQERVNLIGFRLLGPMPAYNFVEEPAWG